MSEKKKLKKGDYLLLLLYADGQTPLLGRTRLQKAAFLFEREVLKKYRFNKELGLPEDTLGFKAYHYGPFSKKVFQFINFFEKAGLVVSTHEENPETKLDMEVFLDNLLQEEDSDWEEEYVEIKRDAIPVFRLTDKGKVYVERKLWPYLNTEQIQALGKLKRNCTESSLKLLIKYVYNNYKDFAVESKIKEEILKETKWQF